ncbi:hypothetical protein [Rhodocyclus purpureus]|uniref:hypothetical protein n=1 Tax=Rhodocyclus purpureus TaxID=1067 RepID=UPI001912CFF8|nr:hypothetical protein [Rhodocyclus purpureus]
MAPLAAADLLANSLHAFRVAQLVMQGEKPDSVRSSLQCRHCEARSAVAIQFVLLNLRRSSYTRVNLQEPYALDRHALRARDDASASRHCEARSAVAIRFVRSSIPESMLAILGRTDVSPTPWIATPFGLAMTGLLIATASAGQFSRCFTKLFHVSR